jgi:hypothetical protein
MFLPSSHKGKEIKLGTKRKRGRIEYSLGPAINPRFSLI